MYIERKIDSYLAEWKLDEDRKPLIIKGARQIGKTESIRRFAKKNYKNFIEINFVDEPIYKQIIVDGYKASDIVKNISLIDTTKRFEPKETLIFFDELQEFPEIATSLKFFRQDGRFDVICSGSLLGIQYHRIESVSVGNKTDYVMRSLDFEEFLWAKGYQEQIDDMLRHMLERAAFSELELQVYNKLFLDYCVLGGMPAVVRSYLEKDTFEGTLELQREILNDYKEDMRKYAEGLDQTRILNVFNRIVPQLGQDNRKFQISKVERGARFKDYFGCIDWLVDAGIVNRCYCMRMPELPLGGNYDEDKYKLYMADTGLLIAMLDEEEQLDIRANRNLGTYKGALYENFIGEALVKQGYNLYYYKREDSRLEEDFFVRDAKSLVPVEVKAGSTKSKTLQTLIKSEKYQDINYGIKFIKENVGENDSMITFPHFCAFLLKRFLSTGMKYEEF